MDAEHVSQAQSGSIENVREVSRKLSSRVEDLSPNIFHTGAAASMELSFILRVTGRQHDAQFVGQWAPALLLSWLYARGGRIVKDPATRYESGEDTSNRTRH